MTNKELEGYIDKMTDSFKELNATFSGMINQRLDEIIRQNEIRNGRIEKNEDKMEVLDVAIAERSATCMIIQQTKERNVNRNRWIIGTLLVIIGLVSGMFYTTQENNKVPIELIYQKTDSTYVIPNLYMRGQCDQKYFEVHKIYVDVNKEK